MSELLWRRKEWDALTIDDQWEAYVGQRTTVGKQATRIRALESRLAEYERAICQELGKALDYPWFKDDQKNFPGATEDDGVCVGDHVAETLAMEAANRIREYERTLRHLLAHIRTYTQEAIGRIERALREGEG